MLISPEKFKEMLDSSKLRYNHISSAIFDFEIQTNIDIYDLAEIPKRSAFLITADTSFTEITFGLMDKLILATDQTRYACQLTALRTLIAH